MSALFLIVTFLIHSSLISFTAASEDVATVEVSVDGTTETATTTETEETVTLGQKLLEKQEFYEKHDASSHHYASTGSTAIGVRIYNPNKVTYDMYWYDAYRQKGIYKGKVKASHLQTTNSYIGHVFYITPRNEPDNEIFRITIEKGKNMYIIPPDWENNNVNEEFWQEILKRQQFFKEYEEKHGIPWLAYYPRDPPILHMWSADYIGQTHTITSNEPYWLCIPKNANGLPFFSVFLFCLFVFICLYSFCFISLFVQWIAMFVLRLSLRLVAILKYFANKQSKTTYFIFFR